MEDMLGVKARSILKIIWWRKHRWLMHVLRHDNNLLHDITEGTRASAIAEEPRDVLRQLKYYGRFLTEL